MRKAFSTLAVVGALALAAAACGGGGSAGGSSQGQAYVNAIVANFTEAEDGQPSPVTQGDARCAGERIVQILGTDRLGDAGATPDEIRTSDSLEAAVPDLTDDEANQIVDAIYDCVDVSDLFVAGFAASAAENGLTLPQDKIDCLANNFESSERLRDAFARSIITGEDPDFESDTSLITEILGNCLTIEELLQIGQQAGQ